VLAVVSLFGAASLSAQGASTTGQIRGQVLGGDGQPVAGASVLATNSETGLQRSTITNDRGLYMIMLLPPGEYSVGVEMLGYADQDVDEVRVSLGQAATVNFDLTTEAVEIEGITFEAFPVEHSIRAPAVGYRITAGRVTVWYAPDLVYIEDRDEALQGCKLYIGDGATLTRSFVRKRGDTLIGHTPVRTQLTWCRKEGVPRALITHCGSEIVEGDERTLGAELREMADERGVDAGFAHDGMEVVLR